MPLSFGGGYPAKSTEKAIYHHLIDTFYLVTLHENTDCVFLPISISIIYKSISISVFNKYAICVSEQKTICSFSF